MPPYKLKTWSTGSLSDEQGGESHQGPRSGPVTQNFLSRTQSIISRDRGPLTGRRHVTTQRTPQTNVRVHGWVTDTSPHSNQWTFATLTTWYRTSISLITPLRHLGKRFSCDGVSSTTSRWLNVTENVFYRSTSPSCLFTSCQNSCSLQIILVNLNAWN